MQSPSERKLDRTILIIGATGKQGGAVLRALHGKHFKLRALTRDPEGHAAKRLAEMGIEVMKGDMSHQESLERAMEGVWGVFSMSTMLEGGVQQEEEQGLRVAQVAKDKGVHRFVFTSVASAGRQTGIPHFESKWKIEEKIRSLQFPSYAILRPVFFMENLSNYALHGDKLTYPIGRNTKLQMIAVEDIGKFGALMFEQADRYRNEEVELAGDGLTLQTAAEEMSHEALGRKIEFEPSPIEEMERAIPDLAHMFRGFENVGYSVDIDELERKYGLKLTRFRDWARKDLLQKQEEVKGRSVEGRGRDVPRQSPGSRE